MSLMPRLSGVYLQTTDPEKLAQFYVDHLGMAAQSVNDTLRLGFDGEDAQIILKPGLAPVSQQRSDRYWKIGITLPNLDIAHANLRAKNVAVSEPHQFQEIGYMCHLTDPAGYQIELLEHEFQYNRPKHAGDPSKPLGGGARIGQITLRTSDIEASLSCYQSLGMRLLSIQPVPEYGFDLYFLGFTDDTPPNRDLRDVANRPWLWQRPYTTLEFQHRPDIEITRHAGYLGLEIFGLSQQMDDEFGDVIFPG